MSDPFKKHTRLKLLLGFCLFLSLGASAQIHGLFKYQGLARNSSGNPVTNQNISLRVSIRQGSVSGTVVYKETHTTATNAFGAFNINIGSGTVVSGNFGTIPWSRNAFFQQVEMDITGGTNFVSMGTSQYLSVPYALSADSARDGVAPFVVVNTVDGNTVAAVAMAAIANTSANNAPVLYVKNNGLGTSLLAESGNGIFILGDSTGFETNGESFLGGKVRIFDSLRVSAPLTVNANTFLNNNVTIGGTLTAPILTGTQANFSNAITTAGATVNGDMQINGNLGVTGNVGVLNATLINGTQGNFSVSVTTPGINVNGDEHVFGNLQVDGNVGVLNASLINGTQGNFSTSLTTPSLTVNGGGHVFGNLQVDGMLSKGGGSFKIDHPLYPKEKFLYHSFVESPDMKNIYDGTVTTDAEGNATVELPAYFEALNRDFRYQLTAIGQFAQAIVSKEISNNHFNIKTDKPHVKISWQVTGIRKDAYAEQYRIVPEVEKNNEEKGKLLYPLKY